MSHEDESGFRKTLRVLKEYRALIPLAMVSPFFAYFGVNAVVAEIDQLISVQPEDIEECTTGDVWIGNRKIADEQDHRIDSKEDQLIIKFLENTGQVQVECRD